MVISKKIISSALILGLFGAFAISNADAASLSVNKNKALQSAVAKKSAGISASRAVLTPGILKKSLPVSSLPSASREGGFGGTASGGSNSTTGNTSGANTAGNVGTDTSRYVTQQQLETTNAHLDAVEGDLIGLQDSLGSAAYRNAQGEGEDTISNFDNGLVSAAQVQGYVSDQKWLDDISEAETTTDKQGLVNAGQVQIFFEDKILTKANDKDIANAVSGSRDDGLVSAQQVADYIASQLGGGTGSISGSIDSSITAAVGSPTADTVKGSHVLDEVTKGKMLAVTSNAVWAELNTQLGTGASNTTMGNKLTNIVTASDLRPITSGGVNQKLSELTGNTINPDNTLNNSAQFATTTAVHNYINSTLGDIHQALMLINGTANSTSNTVQ
jgi:hypothetical protein